MLSAVFLTSKTPPKGFCLPRWYYRAQDWESEFGTVRTSSKCRYSDATGDLECDPEIARKNAEQSARASGYTGPLSLDVYTLARTIRSEHGSGTPAEKAAIAWASVNRAKNKGKTITEYSVHRDRKTYGRQTGNIRPISTRQEPRLSDIYIAHAILSGDLPDPTNGATHYFDPVAQGRSHGTKTPREVYELWNKSYGLQWVGHVPGVLPERLFLMKPGKAGPEIYEAGLLVLENKNPTPPVLAKCPSGWPWAIGIGVAVIGSFVWLRKV